MADLSALIAQVEILQRQVEILSQRTMEGRRVITAQGLSDIDTRLGIVQAGELRFGTRTGAFSGLRLAYPSFGTDAALLAAVESDVNNFYVTTSGIAVARKIVFQGVTANPAYVDGQAIVYYYSSGADDELRVRGKDGATETQVTLANITP